MGPFGLGHDNLDGGISQLSCTQKMMNFDIHIDYIWKQSIFHVFYDVADNVSVLEKRAREKRKHKKRNPSLYFRKRRPAMCNEKEKELV